MSRPQDGRGSTSAEAAAAAAVAATHAASSSSRGGGSRGGGSRPHPTLSPDEVALLDSLADKRDGRGRSQAANVPVVAAAAPAAAAPPAPPPPAAAADRPPLPPSSASASTSQVGVGCPRACRALLVLVQAVACAGRLGRRGMRAQACLPWAPQPAAVTRRAGQVHAIRPSSRMWLCSTHNRVQREGVLGGLGFGLGLLHTPLRTCPANPAHKHARAPHPWPQQLPPPQQQPLLQATGSRSISSSGDGCSSSNAVQQQQQQHRAAHAARTSAPCDRGGSVAVVAAAGGAGPPPGGGKGGKAGAAVVQVGGGGRGWRRAAVQG